METFRGEVTPLRRGRIGCAAAIGITPETHRFCSQLGRELGSRNEVVLVTGGRKHRRNRDGTLSSPPAGDFAVVEGFISQFENTVSSIKNRLETLLPAGADKPFYFRLGNLPPVRTRTRQSRRFALVSSCDVLFAISGTVGTREIIDLAFALERPILPLPFTGGEAQKKWNDREANPIIREWFEITDDEATWLETIRLDGIDESNLSQVAYRIVDILLRRVGKKCFVMMPFSPTYRHLYDQAIVPGLKDSGFLPVRTDDLDLVGDIVDIIRAAIHSCDCGVAVINGFNPNVMYELGLIHGEAKPVVLVCERLSDGYIPQLPFDLQNQTVIGYSSDDITFLRSRISEILERL